MHKAGSYDARMCLQALARLKATWWCSQTSTRRYSNRHQHRQHADTRAASTGVCMHDLIYDSLAPAPAVLSSNAQGADSTGLQQKG
jgi:hypothetical protein